MKNSPGDYDAGLLNGRELILVGEVEFDEREMFGLKPGEKVIKIGVPAKSGKQTSCSRVCEFVNPMVYSGVVRYDDCEYMAFSNKTPLGEPWHHLWKWIDYGEPDERGYEGELLLIDLKTLTPFIHKATFERAADTKG